MSEKKKRTKKTAVPETATNGAECPSPIDEALETLEKLAESQVDMARLFLSHGKRDFALRRLHDVIENYSRSQAVAEARQLLKTLEGSGR